MLQARFIIRQARRSSRQATLFVLCVALSLTTITAFSGFSRNIEDSLRQDARNLHAGDIIIQSYDPISAPLARSLDQLAARGRVARADVHEFYSVVRGPGTETTVLSQLKVVGGGYPFYGRVALKSGKPLHQVLVPGRCVVEQLLLDRTGLDVGDTLKVGYTRLTIADVVTAEPDRSLNLFSFGPRVFIAARDLEALGLIEKGSRIKRIVLLKVTPEKDIDPVARELRLTARPNQESVDTFQTAPSRIRRFMDNFLFFLKLVGLFILMIFGLGIQGTLTALLNEKQRTIAIMKTVGATNRYITAHFMLLVLCLGILGTLMGILAGVAVQAGLAWTLAPILPTGAGILAISWFSVAEGVLLGLGVVALFSFLPLYRLREMRPAMIFRRQSPRAPKKWPVVLSGTLFLAFFFGLVLWHMRDARFGIHFVGGISALILVTALLTQLMLWGLKRCPTHHLAIRQAIKGLFRQGNATRPIIVTLAVSLAVIFANYLIEQNLNATFVQSFPEEAPNAFFLDIQPDQAGGVSRLLGRRARLYPIVRARVTAINEIPIDREQERAKRRDNLSRMFNLTFRHDLLADETLMAGKALYRPDWSGPQVSIMDTVADMGPMGIGDMVSFKIQGVPLTARISSIRTRSKASFNPFFYFVFQENTLKQAPHTLFAALKVGSEQIGPLQNTVVNRYPNISVIDISEAIGVFARLMTRLSGIVRIFSGFSIAAGILILISAVFATRAERMVESVYYKILGANNRFVFKVFALENLIIGLIGGVLALGMAQAGAYWVCHINLDIPYHPFPAAAGVMMAATLLFIVGVGLTASRSILKKKPATYLREQPDA